MRFSSLFLFMLNCQLCNKFGFFSVNRPYLFLSPYILCTVGNDADRLNESISGQAYLLNVFSQCIKSK